MATSGRPWYRLHSKNAQAQFGNWWSDLIVRVVKKESDFPRLPFGSLRDLLPNVLRREYRMKSPASPSSTGA